MKYAEMNVLYCLDRNLFTLCCFLMYPKLTKKLDNKILNPKKIGDWEQLTFLDYNTFLQKKKTLKSLRHFQLSNVNFKTRILHRYT